MKTFTLNRVSFFLSLSLSLPLLLHRIAMRSAVTRLLLVRSMRRSWQQQQQQQHTGSGRMEAILSPSSISPSPPPFSPPSSSFSSSSSTSTSPPPTPFHLLDRVFVSGMPFFARHGVHPAEAELGQRFEVDAEVFIDGLVRSVLAEEGEEKEQRASSTSSSSRFPPADSVPRTFDYSRIHAVARAVVADGPRAQLVETLAARIADALLEEGGGAGEGEGGEREGATTPPSSSSLSSSSSSSSPFFEVVGARVRVTKPGAPIPGVFGEAGCEVVRWKKGQQRR